MKIFKTFATYDPSVSISLSRVVLTYTLSWNSQKFEALEKLNYFFTINYSEASS